MDKLTIKHRLELRKLKDQNVSKVEISYSGGGDDGCIDIYEAWTVDVYGKEKYDKDIDLTSFSDAFDDYIYELLSDTIEWDWVNNEGGYGMLEIDVENGKATIHHNQRVIEEFHYHQENHEALKNLSKNLNHGSPITA
tara:strand:- start:1753 stop:2166 length:414 start_codon:yes stop_codon:yes gene_type:complete